MKGSLPGPGYLQPEHSYRNRNNAFTAMFTGVSECLDRCFTGAGNIHHNAVIRSCAVHVRGSCSRVQPARLLNTPLSVVLVPPCYRVETHRISNIWLTELDQLVGRDGSGKRGKSILAP